MAGNGLVRPADPRSQKTEKRNGVKRKKWIDPPKAGERKTKNATGKTGRSPKLRVRAMLMKLKARARRNQEKL